MLNILHIKEEGKELDEAIEKVMAIIDLYPEIFPHLYKQGFKLKKYFAKGGVILQDGVVITFNRYKSNGKISKNAVKKYQSVPHKPGKVYKKGGDFIIHQIASDHSVKGAAKKVFDKFVSYCKNKDGIHAESIFLTVREKNNRAIDAYIKWGFIKEGEINWKSKVDGIIPGLVFKYNLLAEKNIQTIQK